MVCAADDLMSEEEAVKAYMEDFEKAGIRQRGAMTLELARVWEQQERAAGAQACVPAARQQQADAQQEEDEDDQAIRDACTWPEVLPCLFSLSKSTCCSRTAPCLEARAFFQCCHLPSMFCSYLLYYRSGP